MTLTIPSAASFDHVNPFRTNYLNRGNRIFKNIYIYIYIYIYTQTFQMYFFSIIINKKLIQTICSNKSKKQVSLADLRSDNFFPIVKELIYR